MKYIKKLIVLATVLGNALIAQANECKIIQDVDKLAKVRSEAQVTGNYAQGWLLEKPGMNSGSLRCKPTEVSGVQKCAKQGTSSFITLNNQQELISGVIIEARETTEFLIKADGEFECLLASTPKDHNPEDSDNKLHGGIILAFSPSTNANGFCEPERVDIADTDIDGKRLISIRGDARYTMPTGVTNIPFQSLHKYPDQNGFSDTDAIIGLNHDGVCKDLTIDMTIRYCEYSGTNARERARCPDIQIKGASAFSAINIERHD